MNAEELASTLNGRQYREEITREEEAVAKAAGLVVVYGASDDLMEFAGAIHDEAGCYGGHEAFITPDGLLTNKCEDEDCPYFATLEKRAASIKAHWDQDGYSWVYTTSVPHHTFDIMEDGDKYCRGIVFALAGVPPLT